MREASSQGFDGEEGGLKGGRKSVGTNDVDCTEGWDDFETVMAVSLLR